MQERKIIALLRERDQQGLHALLVHDGPLCDTSSLPFCGTLRSGRRSFRGDHAGLGENRYLSGGAGKLEWLASLARHAALNHARRISRHGGAEALSEDPPSPELTPEEVLLRQERQTALQAALGQLSAGERLLFYRKYYYLPSTARIALELGLTERAVEGRLYRLKRQLRKLPGGDEGA